MQIKTTMRYYFMPVKMAVIKKAGNNKCWQGCGGKQTLIYCWWDCKLVQPLWKTVWRLLKKLKATTCSSPTSGYFSEEYDNSNLKSICGLPWWVVQWLRICLLMQRTQIQSLIREDCICWGATKPVRHSYWAHVPQLPKPTL